MSSHKSMVAQRQNPLRKSYRTDPQAAWITDGAVARVGDARDAFHGELVANNSGGQPWAIGIHRAVGGDHDLPNPGDILCAALAGCLHTTTRMLADRLDVPVLDLAISVTAEVDVRGCLLVDPNVPVGFQRMHVSVQLHVPDGIEPPRLRLLMDMAERCCVVEQTLAGGTEIHTDWEIKQDLAAAQ